MVILDTNILIEIVHRNGEVISRCDALGTRNLTITTITRNEFLLGSRDKESFVNDVSFVNKFGLLALSEPIDTIFSQLCETYALSHRPSVPDMLIAAAALSHNCELYTLNIKDFRFIKGLKLIL